MLLDWQTLLLLVCRQPQRTFYDREGSLDWQRQRSPRYSAAASSTLTLHYDRPCELRVELIAGSQGKIHNTLWFVECRGGLSSIGKVNRGGHPRLIPDDACGVPFARQIFCQIDMTGTETVQAAISEADFHFAL
jgi:hypothetical protein